MTQNMAEPATVPTETPTKPAPSTTPDAPPAVPVPDRRERRELPIIEPAKPDPFHNPCHGSFGALSLPPRF